MAKKLTVAVIPVIIAALAVAGCATPTTNPTPSTTTAQQTSSDVSSAITQTFVEHNYTIVTPFTKVAPFTPSAYNVSTIPTYTGVVKDGERTPTSYTHNITIQMPVNQATTDQLFDSLINAAMTQGYVKVNSQSFDTGRTWEGDESASHAYIVAQEPNASLRIVYNSSSPVSVSALSDEYLVSTDYASAA
ncbi:MAG: hypothetical protein ACXVI3_00285 [Halobacteriota archaeon]